VLAGVVFHRVSHGVCAVPVLVLVRRVEKHRLGWVLLLRTVQPR